MTDVKVRGVSAQTVKALKKCAADNGRSLESEIRRMLDGAAQEHVQSPEDLLASTMFQVDEIVPSRLYDFAFKDRLFRLSVHRLLGCTDGKAWYATVDEAVDAAGYERVWIQAEAFPRRFPRYVSATACLTDALHWLRAVANNPGSPEDQRLRAKVDAIRKRILKSAQSVTSEGENLQVNFRYS